MTKKAYNGEPYAIIVRNKDDGNMEVYGFNNRDTCEAIAQNTLITCGEIVDVYIGEFDEPVPLQGIERAIDSYENQVARPVSDDILRRFLKS